MTTLNLAAFGIQKIGGLMRLVLLAIASLASATAAFAAEPVSLQPVSPWGIDYGENNCTLYRTFGEGENSVNFGMTQFGFDGPMRFTVTGKNMRAVSNDLKWAFEPASDLVPAAINDVVTLSDGSTGIVFSGGFRSSTEISRIESETKDLSDHEQIAEAFDWPAEARAIRYAEIQAIHMVGGNEDLVLATGPLTKPLSAMSGCTDDLMANLGLNPITQKSLRQKAKPKGNPAKWVSPADFPENKLKGGTTRIVNFQLIVSASGAPEACQILEVSKPDIFARLTCDTAMKRAKFEPAIDSTGNPVKSYWTSRVNWTQLDTVHIN